MRIAPYRSKRGLNRPAFLAALAGAVAVPGRASAIGEPLVRPAPVWSAELIELRPGSGRLGIAAIDLHNGRRLLRGAVDRFPLASTFKLPLVMDVLTHVDRATEHLDLRIRFTAGDILPNSPTVAAQPHGGAFTVRELCAAAIEHSDNSAANLLLHAVGGPPGVTAYLRGLGDAVTRLDRSEPALNEAVPGDPRDTTTPLAMATLMAKLVREPLLSSASKALLFDWLRRCDTGMARIRAGVPPAWTVGDKTGTTDSGANDVAILWPPRGAPIVLAVYFAEVHASDADRDAAIAAVARIIVRRFRD
jgi:beta-lactamase class A